MRKLIFGMLLASVAVSPALASPDDREERLKARAERQQERQDAREERAAKPDRAERNVKVERVERAERVEAPVRAQAVGRVQTQDVQAIRETRETAREARGANRDALRERRNAAPQPALETQVEPSVRAPMRDRMGDARERIEARRMRPPVISPTPQPGTQPAPPVIQRPTPAPQWNGRWRDDRRYDWNKWRKRNRWLFNLGFYRDPFGWGYQPYQIGWRMWPSYYSSQYWLNDPWRYRLPYAPAGYRWVRYWDDAVLVDTWSGQVVDVIHNFFW